MTLIQYIVVDSYTILIWTILAFFLPYTEDIWFQDQTLHMRLRWFWIFEFYSCFGRNLFSCITFLISYPNLYSVCHNKRTGALKHLAGTIHNLPINTLHFQTFFVRIRILWVLDHSFPKLELQEGTVVVGSISSGTSKWHGDQWLQEVLRKFYVLFVVSPCVLGHNSISRVERP